MGIARGRFITLEGGEGAGKSTQARRLAETLRGQGREVVLTREPGGSPTAEKIREAILSGAIAPLGPTAEAMMFTAARIDHLDHTIRPALARGAWVVCDRFADSTRAYQGALGDLDPRFIASLERIAIGADKPDLTIMVDVPADLGMARASQRRDGAPDRFEAEGPAFHEALRRSFLEIAASEPGRCVVVNGAQEPDAVAQAIWSAVEARLLTTGESVAAEAASKAAEAPKPRTAKPQAAKPKAAKPQSTAPKKRRAAASKAGAT
jgi:dTMP kinase